MWKFCLVSREHPPQVFEMASLVSGALRLTPSSEPLASILAYSAFIRIWLCRDFHMHELTFSPSRTAHFSHSCAFSNSFSRWELPEDHIQLVPEPLFEYSHPPRSLISKDS